MGQTWEPTQIKWDVRTWSGHAQKCCTEKWPCHFHERWCIWELREISDAVRKKCFKEILIFTVIWLRLLYVVGVLRYITLHITNILLYYLFSTACNFISYISIFIKTQQFEAKEQQQEDVKKDKDYSSDHAALHWNKSSGKSSGDLWALAAGNLIQIKLISPYRLILACNYIC